MIGKRFDQAVKEVMKLCGDMPMIAGVMAFNALTKTYDSLKYDTSMVRQCGLNTYEYLKLLEKIFNNKGRKYISNWNQMMRGTPREEMDSLGDLDYLI